MELQRFTTQYHKEEDRLRLCGEAAGTDAVLELWLTQRMLNALLPHLTAWLEQQGGTSLHAELMQEFQQQAALAALEQQAPVQAQGQAAAVLVRSVDIATGVGFVRLGFKEQEAGPVVACVTLPTQALRQWLGIVYQQSQAGNWPMELWPQWMGLAASVGPQHSPLALH